MAEREARAIRVACIADQSAVGSVLHEAVRTLLPHAEVSVVDIRAEGGTPECEIVVVDAVVHGTRGVDVLRQLRARGYDGSAVLLMDDGANDGEHDDIAADAARLGVTGRVMRAALGEQLGAAIAGALQTTSAARDPRLAPALQSLRRTQQLIAAGQVALRMQHSLNNPLAGLLAESQLLELEPLEPDHKRAVQRIIELCRRVIDVVRGLDGVGRA